MVGRPDREGRRDPAGRHGPFRRPARPRRQRERLKARQAARHVQPRSLRHGRGPVPQTPGPDLAHAGRARRRDGLDHPRRDARADGPRLRPAPDRGRGLAPGVGELPRHDHLRRVAHLGRLHDRDGREGDRRARRPLFRRHGDPDAARHDHGPVAGQDADRPRRHGELRAGAQEHAHPARPVLRRGRPARARPRLHRQPGPVRPALRQRRLSGQDDPHARHDVPGRRRVRRARGHARPRRGGPGDDPDPVSASPGTSRRPTR